MKLRHWILGAALLSTGASTWDAARAASEVGAAGALAGGFAERSALPITINTPVGAVRSASYLGGTAGDTDDDGDDDSSVTRVAVTLRRADGLYWNGATWTSTPALLTTQLRNGSWARSLSDLRGGLLPTRYTVQAYAFDAAGNRGTAGASFILDVTPPQVAISASANGSQHRTLPVLTGTMADLAPSGGTVPAVASGVESVEVLLSAKSFYYFTQPQQHVVQATLSQGTWSADLSELYYLYSPSSIVATVRAMDAAGNVARTAPVAFSFDSRVPVAGLDDPLSRYGITSLRALSRITGTWEEDFAAPRVAMSLLRRRDGRYWNGTTWVTTPLQISGTTVTTRSVPFELKGTWAVNVPPQSALEEGQYSVVVALYDRVSNRTLISTSFIIDRTPPAISFSFPSANATLRTPPDEVLGRIADISLGYPEPRLSLIRLSDGAYWNWTEQRWTRAVEVKNLSLRTGGNFVQALNLNLTNWTPGRYAVRVDATDRAGNSSRATSTFTYQPSTTTARLFDAPTIRASVR